MSKGYIKKSNLYANKGNSDSTKVDIDIRNAVVRTYNNDKIYAKKFRGCGVNAVYCQMFNKYYRSEIEQDILFKCKLSNSEYLKSIKTEKQLNQKLSKYFDSAIYSSLVDLDILNYHTTDKAWEYVKDMLYPIKKGEKEEDVRKKLLKESGIDIKYRMGFPRLWNNCNIIDYFKEMLRAIKSRKLSKVYLGKIQINKKIDTDRKKDNKKLKKQTKIKSDKKIVYIREKEIKNRIKADKKRSILNQKKKMVRLKAKKKETIAKEKEKRKQAKIKEKEKKSKTLKKTIKKYPTILSSITLTSSKGLINKLKNKKEEYKNVVQNKLENAKDNLSRKLFLEKYNKNSIFTAKKGLLDRLKKKVNDRNFKRTLKNLTISSVLSLGIGLVAVSLINNKLTINDTNLPSVEAEVSSTDETNNLEHNVETKKEIENEVIEKKKEIKNEVIEKNISKSDNEEKKDKPNNNIHKADKTKNINTKKVVLQDALIDALEIDFDSQFLMSGTYYETPEETGNYGTFNNDDNLEISYVNVIDEDGTYSSYDEDDGNTISEIKANHPNSEISYHVVTEDDMMLGWVKANSDDLPEENIEQNLVKGSLRNIKKFLDTDTMKFLCNTDLFEYVDENSKYLSNINKAMKQYKKSIEEKQERDSR